METEIAFTSCRQKHLKQQIRHRLIFGLYNDAASTPQIVMNWNKCQRCHDPNQRYYDSHDGITDRKHRLYSLAVYGMSTNWNRCGSCRRVTEEFHEHASRCGQL
jgi:hypothetical protein